MKMKLLSLGLFGLLLNFYCTASEAATITGKIAFQGTAPQAEAIAVAADPTCQLMHPDGIAADDTLVNANGTLKNVFVYVKQGLEGQTFEAPKEAITFDQKGCHYHPQVFGIQ